MRSMIDFLSDIHGSICKYVCIINHLKSNPWQCGHFEIDHFEQQGHCGHCTSVELSQTSVIILMVKYSVCSKSKLMDIWSVNALHLGCISSALPPCL